MKLTQFSILLNDNITIQGECEGNSDSKKAIVFAHGFGVKRDSWGMFNQLGDLLKGDYLVVRFDFVEILEKDNATKVFPLSTQAEMLKAVCAYSKSKLGVAEINIIAHSQGCLVTGLLSPDDASKIILLASPVESPYSRMKQYFASREGTEINEDGLSKIKRSDGSWTWVEAGFWDDIKSIDPAQLYSRLAAKTDLYFVRAMQDHVITDKNYESVKNDKNINFLELPGDHNFAGDARDNWLGTMVDLLKGD
ncbi:MAG: hypothetical protein GF390_00440 [Candidatus Pacebacteria bacterium]|nr:hypothetical protein [Candidatus Paceibacterota bacterium]